MPRPARILCVEDDPNQFALVEKVLRAEGYEVIRAADGVEAIDRALSTNPDLVLLDIRIPGLDGYEVALRLRFETTLSQIPIIAITAHGDSETAQAVGCDEFLPKPIEIPRLRDLVKRFLGGQMLPSRPPPGPIAPRRPEPDVLATKSGEIVDKLKHKIRELEDAHDRIQVLEKSRAEFYRNVSHELYTPLTPSMGYVHLLLEEQLGPITGEQRHAIQGVGKSLGRMKLLIENLLDATALQLGRIPIHPQTFEAHALLVEVSARLEDAIRSKEIDVHIEVAPTRLVKVMTDREKLGRIVYHLLDNSIKFTPNGGVVNLSIQKDSQGFTLKVLDSGSGIPADALEKVFEPFYQLDGSVTRSHGGMGIGLAIARRLVTALEGTIHAESPPKSVGSSGFRQGTLLTVRLPRSIAPVQGDN